MIQYDGQGSGAPQPFKPFIGASDYHLLSESLLCSAGELMGFCLLETETTSVEATLPC